MSIAAFAAVAVGAYGAASLPRPLMPVQATDAYSLPTSTLNAVASPERSALIVIPIGEDVYVREVHDNGPLLTDASALTRLHTAARADNTDSPATPDNTWGESASAPWLADLVTTLATPDVHAVRGLAAHGIDAILVPHLGTPEATRIAHALTRAPGMEPGATTVALTTWRIRPQQGTTQDPSAHPPVPGTPQGAPTSVNSQMSQPDHAGQPPQPHETGQARQLPATASIADSVWPWVVLGVAGVAALACIPRRSREPMRVSEQALAPQGRAHE